MSDDEPHEVDVKITFTDDGEIESVSIRGMGDATDGDCALMFHDLTGWFIEQAMSCEETQH